MFQKLWRKGFQLSAVCCAILLTAALWNPPVFAEDDVKNSEALAATEPSLKVGMIAPDFTLADETGTMRTLSEFWGKKNVVLAFYPKDFTGG